MPKVSETISAETENRVYNIEKLLKVRENFLSKFNRYYALLAVLAILYGVMILVIPPDASALLKYGITASEARLISLSFALPLVIIWTTAFYGFIRLQQYAQHVQPGHDGIFLSKVAHGLMFLALSMPLGSISSSLSNYIAARRPNLMPLAVILNNYLSLILVLIGFYFIYRGASGLVSLLKKRSQYSSHERFIMTMFLVISGVYSYLTLTNPARQFPTASVHRPAYFMADFPLVLTIVIPYLFVWFFGIRSVYYVYLYRKRIKGVLYRDALGLLAAGLSLVIISSMILRYLVSLNTLFSSLTLKILLLVLYALVFVMFAGYLLIARGVKQLQRIEEV